MLEINAIEGIPATKFRGIACIAGSDSIIDESTLFEFLCQDNLVRQQMMSRMNGWINRFPKGDRPKQYHGWNRKQFNGKYTECFVFKYRNDRFDIRIYGFKCHPIPDDSRFELFVPVVVIDQKRQHETDETNLKRVVGARCLRQVQDCLDRYEIKHQLGSTK